MHPRAPILALLLAAFGASEALGQEGERIGDWLVEVSTDPFRDAQRVSALLRVDGLPTEGILSVVLRCDVRLFDETLSLVVTHSELTGRDGEVELSYRLGEAEERTVSGALTSGGTVTRVTLEGSELAALAAHPSVAVRLVDPETDEVRVASWNALEGTAAMLGSFPCPVVAAPPGRE